MNNKIERTLSLLLISIFVAFAASGSGKEKFALKEKTKQISVAKTVQNPIDFKTFLQTFIKSLKEKKSPEGYIHKEIGVYVYSNPGAHCVVAKGKRMEPLNRVKEISINNIFNRKPKGDSCEGYPGEKDGFYYIKTTQEGLPSYYDADSNADKKVILPATLNYKKFIKVNVIIGESFCVDLYFACIDSSWYLIGQNFCDCSA
jgi:hypothetical protein